MSKKLTIYVDLDNTLLATFEGARKFAQQSIYGGDFHSDMDIVLNKPLDKDVTTYSTTATTGNDTYVYR